MKRMTGQELADWKQRMGNEPGVKVSIDPNAPRNPDGSLNDIVVHGGGRFNRVGLGRARLFKNDEHPISEGTVESMPFRGEGLSYLTSRDMGTLEKVHPVLAEPFVKDFDKPEEPDGQPK